MGDFFLYGFCLSLSVAFALIFVFAANFFVYHGNAVISKHGEPLIIKYVLSVILLGAAITTLLSGRKLTLSHGEIYSTILDSQSMSISVLSRMLMMSIVILSGVMMARKFRFSTLTSNGYLFPAYLFFFVFSTVLSMFFGTRGGGDYSLLYTPIILVMFMLLGGMTYAELVKFGCVISGLFVFFSLVVALIYPEVAIEKPYVGSIKIVDFRLWGLASHANAMGPIALFFLLTLTQVIIDRKYKIIFTIIGLLALLLSQSKTVWVISLMSLTVVYVFSSDVKCKSKCHGVGRDEQSLAFSRLLIIIYTISILLCVTYYSGLLDVIIEKLMGGSDSVSLRTFTGRTLIWQLTIDEWLYNPLFGYGPELWGVEYRYKMGMMYAGQAHNQFVQTLGDSGLVGLFGLIVYLFTLFFYSVKFCRRTNGLSFALSLLIFIRTISETPLKTSRIFEVPFFIHAFLFLLLLILQKELTNSRDN